MKKIVAIGGGEIGLKETLKIDKEVVKLTGKRNPKALFIPTASGDAEGYWDKFQKIYGKKLRCKTDVLYLMKEKLGYKEIKNKILSSDLIYVGGGNTLKMMKTWRKLGVDKILKKAYEKGIVLSGLSAGSICWFKNGMSDSIPGKWTLVSGLCLINATNNVHYSNERGRKGGFKKIMKKQFNVGIALENFCALEIIDNKYRLITSRKKAKAYKVYSKNGKVIRDIIEQRKELRPLTELLSK